MLGEYTVGNCKYCKTIIHIDEPYFSDHKIFPLLGKAVCEKCYIEQLPPKEKNEYLNLMKENE